MPLDSFTLLISTSATLVLIGCALLYFWNRDRQSSWLLWWCFPFLAGGLSALSYLQPNWSENYVSIAIANGLRIGTLSLLWQGARVFGGRSSMLWGNAVIVCAWFALCLVPGFIESMAARIVAVSVGLGLVCVLAAWELWRDRAEALPSRRMAIGVLVSFSVVMAIRIAGVNSLPFPMGALPLDPLWMGIFDLLVFAHATFLGLLLIALTKERLELQQRTMTLIDPLTTLMNRRAFMLEAERRGRRPIGERDPMALLVLDLDHFKMVNDRFGHDVGDVVLKAFAALAEASTRAADQLYRLGGEEFCFLLPHTEVEEALQVAERIRQELETSTIATVRSDRVRITVSIGVAATEFAGFDLDVLRAAADAALYEAKARGRNRIVLADPTTLGQPAPVTESDVVRLWA